MKLQIPSDLIAQGTLIAQPDTARCLGSIPGCLALSATDIGEAELANGMRVYITWGRDLSKTEQKFFLAHTCLVPIWISHAYSPADGSAELILRSGDAQKLLTILHRH